MCKIVLCPHEESTIDLFLCGEHTGLFPNFLINNHAELFQFFSNEFLRAGFLFFGFFFST